MSSYEDEEYYSSEDGNMGDQMIEDEGHLAAEDLDGVQTKYLYITLEGSMEDLAKNNAKATWKMFPEVHKKLRQVVTSTNKTKASDDQYEGNLKKTVIVQGVIKQQFSNFPVALGLSFPSMLPTTFTKNKRFNCVVEKNTPTMLVNQSIFEPDSDFTRYMYESLEKIDSESLDRQIKFGHPNGALFDPNGYAWKVLMKNVRKGTFPGAEDRLFEQDAQADGNPHAFPVVPEPIARSIHTAIRDRLDQVESSFTDLTTFGCNWSRADGKAWNSTKGLIGSNAGQYQDGKSAITSHKLTNEYSASVVMEIKYFTY